MFDSFASKGFYSIELLINLNSFGFIREGCRVLGVCFDEEQVMEDLVEYDSTQLIPDKKSKDALDKIAGGDYWVEIIERKRNGITNAYEAEAEFAEAYCKRLRQSYTYVLNMPLRIKKGQVPKYRMIHATNHADGALIMVDNIFGRWELMKNIQSEGQQSLFEENADNEIVDREKIREQVNEHLSKVTVRTRLNPLMADFYCTYGVVCRTSVVKEFYKCLESNGKIEVCRTPAKTPTGRATTFFTDEKGKIVELRWKK